MIVDVTLSRGNGIVGPPRLQSQSAHRRAVETIVTALGSQPNWYLDLANERDVPYQSLLKVYLSERLARERGRKVPA